MHVLLATDGSQPALAASAAVCELTLETSDLVTVFAAAEPGRETDARAGLLASREALAHCTASVETELGHGPAAGSILDAAVRHQAELIVLGASGRSAITRLLIGSVAERVAHDAPCSVLVVRPGHSACRSVMLGADGSAESEAAARWLRRFPLPEDSQVRLTTLVPNLYHMTREQFLIQPPLTEHTETLADWSREQVHVQHERLIRELEAAGVRASGELRDGDPTEGLIRAASEEGVDLLVLGSRSHGALERALLGSISEAVLRHAPCSVLLVKQAAVPSAAASLPAES